MDHGGYNSTGPDRKNAESWRSERLHLLAHSERLHRLPLFPIGSQEDEWTMVATIVLAATVVPAAKVVPIQVVFE